MEITQTCSVPRFIHLLKASTHSVPAGAYGLSTVCKSPHEECTCNQQRPIHGCSFVDSLIHTTISILPIHESISVCTSMSPTRHPSHISIYVSICIFTSVFNLSLINRTHEYIHISHSLSPFNPTCVCKYVRPQTVTLLTTVLVYLSILSIHNPNPSPVSLIVYMHRAMYQ